MPSEAVEIVRCPAALRAEALSLVLCELAPSVRRTVAGRLMEADDADDWSHEPLFVARSGKTVCGAAWGQRQSGNIAIFWPPQFVAGANQLDATRLAEAVVRDLDQTSIQLAEAILATPSVDTIGVLRTVGFRHLADLWYMTCESRRFPTAAPESEGLEFEPYRPAQRSRLMKLITRTYEDTLDCTALDGVRDIEQVVNGYQATGVFRSELWMFVRSGGEDVGVLLLTEHPQARHWELMYLGLVKEARGRGRGRQIARYAQWLAQREKIERIVVAVDASNRPAVAVYQQTGFEMWDMRAVYVRVFQQQHAEDA